MKLKEIFIGCERPLFLVEGVIYFLSPECVTWLFNEIASYESSAMILDYWPEEGIGESQCFSNAVSDLRGFMKENIVSFFTKEFWSKEHFNEMTNKLTVRSNFSMLNTENHYAMIEDEAPQFIDQNQFFPVQLFIGEIKHSLR